ncbi:MAG: hypothetical protein HY716_08790 [Planctomycetes bacterium]|nr:hypothetical protein [Planctomycetota bacterium]
MLRALVIGVLLASAPSAGVHARQEPPASPHGKMCPENCAKCGDAVKHALEFLTQHQDESGRIPMEKTGKRGANFTNMFKQAGDVMTTSLAGLAFLGAGNTTTAGPHREQVAKIKQYLSDLPRRRVNGDTWPAALALIFYSALHQKEKDAASKESMAKLVAFLSKQQSKQGGWSLGRAQGFMTEDTRNLTAAVNVCIFALGWARAAGAEVNPEVFERSKRFLEKTYRDDGWFNYMIKRDNGEPREGRAVAGLLALHYLGAAQEEKFAATYTFARRNMERVTSHHVPHLHLLLAGFAYRLLGAEDWEKFAQVFFDKLIACQGEDGGAKALFKFDRKIMMTIWTDHSFGPNYATAVLAALLQVPRYQFAPAPSKPARQEFMVK